MVTSETEYCIEVQAMIGCNCVWHWGIPECDELHFCLYDSCQYLTVPFRSACFVQVRTASEIGKEASYEFPSDFATESSSLDAYANC